MSVERIDHCSDLVGTRPLEDRGIAEVLDHCSEGRILTGSPRGTIGYRGRGVVQPERQMTGGREEPIATRRGKKILHESQEQQAETLVGHRLAPPIAKHSIGGDRPSEVYQPHRRIEDADLPRGIILKLGIEHRVEYTRPMRALALPPLEVTRSASPGH